MEGRVVVCVWRGVSVCLCVCACVRAYVRACIHACVRACVRVCSEAGIIIIPTCAKLLTSQLGRGDKRIKGTTAVFELDGEFAVRSCMCLCNSHIPACTGT